MQATSHVAYSRAIPHRAALALFVRRERYLDLATEHEVAVNLEAPDIRAAYDQGKYPKPGWQLEARAHARAHAAQLVSGLRGALFTTTAFVAIGLLLGFAFGRVGLTLPIAEGKWLSTIGGFLAAWATLFELGGYAETYGGEALHEVVRPVLFTSIFLPGLAIAAVGQLW